MFSPAALNQDLGWLSVRQVILALKPGINVSVDDAKGTLQDEITLDKEV
jgi:hypothetical protein